MDKVGEKKMMDGKNTPVSYIVEMTDNKDGTFTVKRVSRFRKDQARWVETGPGNVINTIRNGQNR